MIHIGANSKFYYAIQKSWTFTQNGKKFTLLKQKYSTSNQTGPLRAFVGWLNSQPFVLFTIDGDGGESTLFNLADQLRDYFFAHLTQAKLE